MIAFFLLSLYVSTKVKIFKDNPDGIVSVKFKEAEPALNCVKLMNGR
jgi:hypothetical protein